MSTPRDRLNHPRYAELHCKTNFSFLRGASHADELVDRAAELGYHALAVTDRNTLAGVVRMHCAAKLKGLKVLIGAEIVPADAPPVALYATDRAAYGRLSRLISRGRLRMPKGACAVRFDDVAELSEGLIGVVLPTVRSPLLSGTNGASVPAPEQVAPYRDVFGDRLYVAAEVHAGHDDRQCMAAIADVCLRTDVPMVAANDVHYHEPKRRFLQDILVCIRERCAVTEAGARLFTNGERHLKTPEQMVQLFHAYPQAIARTIEIADRCTFSLDALHYTYPEELCPADQTPIDYLAELTWQGTRDRFPGEAPEGVRCTIERELRLIREMSYEPYFLTVWDLVRFARSRGILCQGRGSAANSAVCYCLGITNVDPSRIDLLFERFVSKERNEPPDIDVDFEHERREEVFQYIYGKYGREHAGIVAEVITYRPRSAVRDVGKALGLSLDRVDLLAKKLEWWSDCPLPNDSLVEAGLDPNDRTIRLLASLVKQIVGFPRHLSQHVGGFVITRDPLCEMVPIENAAMPNRTFIEWDKDDIDALGILKVDCLALGMMTAIGKCLDLSIHRSMSDIPPEDPAVYDMICEADTVGVFQIESRAQMSMLPRLKPRNFYDLVIEVAIVRPGPIQGGMVHPFLRRRNGEEAVTYPSAAIAKVLHKTLGVPLFQEQAMRLAVVGAGFTPGEADQLRRAMGAWRRSGKIEEFRVKLLEGMRRNGLSEAFAQRCFEQISGFGEYGFPESHAASFALLVYVSAWLKRYYPAAFTAGLLNSQPMGFYAPAQLVRDAREHGVEVRPVDVNESGYDCGLEGRHGGTEARRHAGKGARRYRGGDPARWGVGGPVLRLGMRLVKGISRDRVAGIETARRDGPFTSVVDLVRRSAVQRGVLARLAAADAFRSMGLNRRQAVWQSLVVGHRPWPLFDGIEVGEKERHGGTKAGRHEGEDSGACGRPRGLKSAARRAEGGRHGGGEGDEDVCLPELTLADQVVSDYDTVGLSLRAHPISLLRGALNAIKAVPAERIKHMGQGATARVAGLVLVRQRPSTASGVVFYTLEDETGVANLIVRPAVYERCRRHARSAAALIADGRVERQGKVVHLHVSHLRELGLGLATMGIRSRNFR